jgi:hypothetical protein
MVLHWAHGFRWPFACIPTLHAASHAQLSESESDSPAEPHKSGSRSRTASSRPGDVCLDLWLRCRRDGICRAPAPSSASNQRVGYAAKRIDLARELTDSYRDGYEYH